MALSGRECEQIIQTAVVRAGGVNTQHSMGQTLHSAGLKATHQRASFQRHAARGIGQKGHFVDDVGRIPNSGSTTLAAVRDFIAAAAVAIEQLPSGAGE